MTESTGRQRQPMSVNFTLTNWLSSHATLDLQTNLLHQWMHRRFIIITFIMVDQGL